MTETEITLFKELIRETVRGVIKEEKLKMASEVKKELAKDLKEIKLLIVKQIKEGREIRKAAPMIEVYRAPAGREPVAGAPLGIDRIAALNKAMHQTANPGAGVSQRPSAMAHSAVRALKESRLDNTTKNILMQTAMSMTEDDDADLVPGAQIQQDPEYAQSEPEQGYYDGERIEEAYVPKNGYGLPEFPL